SGLELVTHPKDPVAWLEDHLRVEPFGSPQLIRVSISGGDQKSLAIVDAVMEEYVNQIRNEEERRLMRLVQVLHEHNEILSKKTDHYLSAIRIGEMGEEQKQIAKEAWSFHEKELRRVQLE